MRCKSGDLVVVVRTNPACRSYIGRFLTVTKWDAAIERWETDLREGGLLVIVADEDVRPIRDNPGNESWFKAAPLTTTPKVTA